MEESEIETKCKKEHKCIHRVMIESRNKRMERKGERVCV